MVEVDILRCMVLELRDAAPAILIGLILGVAVIIIREAVFVKKK